MASTRAAITPDGSRRSLARHRPPVLAGGVRAPNPDGSPGLLEATGQPSRCAPPSSHRPRVSRGEFDGAVVAQLLGPLLYGYSRGRMRTDTSRRDTPPSTRKHWQIVVANRIPDRPLAGTSTRARTRDVPGS